MFRKKLRADVKTENILSASVYHMSDVRMGSEAGQKSNILHQNLIKSFFFISKLTHRSSLSKLLRLKWFEVEQIEIWPKEIPWASWDGHQSPLWLTLEIFGKLEQIVLRSSWSKEWMWCTIVYELKLILKFDICETVTDMIVQTHVSLSTKKYDFIICWEFYLRLFVISFWLGRISVAVALI